MPFSDVSLAVAFYLVWFRWVEQTAFSTWMRESTAFLAFPNILFLHTLAMGFLGGVNAAVALTILGFAPGLRIAPLRSFLPLMWGSFWIMVVTGLMLLASYPTKAFTNPVWYIKFAFIGLALKVTTTIINRVFLAGDADAAPVPQSWKRLAVLSLVFWAGAITAGKLLAHTYHRLYAVL